MIHNQATTHCSQLKRLRLHSFCQIKLLNASTIRQSRQKQ